MRFSSLEELPNVSDSSKAVISSVVHKLSGETEVLLCLLFGSRARGTHRPDSDTDIFIVTTGEYSYVEFSEYYESLNKLMSTDVSISITNKEEWDSPNLEENVLMQKNLLKDGIAITEYTTLKF